MMLAILKSPHVKRVLVLKAIVATGLTLSHFFPQQVAHVAFLTNMLWLLAF
jgi:hypothetical protein